MPDKYQFDFELRHLVCFREVARRLHFRRAAEALAVAQPALSRSVMHLEQVLGARLFERTRRGVSLTPAGQARSIASSRSCARHPSCPNRCRP